MWREIKVNNNHEINDITFDIEKEENIRKIDHSIDNCIEWYTGDETVTITFSQKKWKNKLLKLAEKHPEDVKILLTNKDGSILAKLPVKYVKLTAPRFFSEDQKKQARLRMQKHWQNNKK